MMKPSRREKRKADTVISKGPRNAAMLGKPAVCSLTLGYLSSSFVLGQTGKCKELPDEFGCGRSASLRPPDFSDSI